MAHPLSTISKIRKANKLFFDKDTMQAFHSKAYGLVKTTDKGAYFITSEIFTFHPKEEDRVYQVRFCSLENGIRTVKKFKRYDLARDHIESIQ